MKNLLIVYNESIPSETFEEKNSHILELAKKYGINTSISYICGIDSLEKMKEGFVYFKDSLSQFPIINIYQIRMRF